MVFMSLHFKKLAKVQLYLEAGAISMRGCKSTISGNKEIPIDFDSIRRDFH